MFSRFLKVCTAITPNCPWRHFPLNHLGCSNPCRPHLAATTIFPCGLFHMWFKPLQCACDCPHNMEEFPRRDMQGICFKHFACCIIGSPWRSCGQQCFQKWVPICEAHRQSSNSFCYAMLVPKKGHKRTINHSLHSFQPCKRSDQWAVSPLQSWWLRKVQVKRHRKKNKFGKHIQTLCQEDSCLLMPLCDGFQESCIYQESRCLFRFRAGMSRALHNFCHAERKQILVIICASSMFCQPCQLMGRSCSNPVHIDHQYWRKGAHAGVSQWPLWEDHSLHSFHSRKGSNQWRVSPSQFWESLSLADTWDLVLGWALVADAAVWQLPATRNHVAFSGSRMSRASNNFCNAGRTKICPRSKSCQSGPLNGHSCSNPVHSNHQYWTESTHASVKQWPLWESHSLHSFHFAKGQINEECLLRNFEKAWVWQTPETLCWDELSCWCRCVTASRNPAFIRNHVACSDSEQEWAEHWTTFAMLKENKHLWSLVLVQCFASLANWWGVHAAIQFISNTSTAGRHMQWPLWENHSLPSFHYCQGPDQWRVSASRCRKLRTLDLGRHLRPCVKMCQEDFLVADAAVWRLPAILLPYSIRSKNEQIMNNSCYLLLCWKDKHLP